MLGIFVVIILYFKADIQWISLALVAVFFHF